MFKTLMTLAIMLYCTVLGAVAQAPEGWQIFTPPSKEFTILMPPNVQRSVRNMAGQNELIYHQTDSSGVPYGVSEGLYINPRHKLTTQPDFYKLVVEQAEANFKQTLHRPYKMEEQDVQGKGWHGKKVLFTSNDDGLATFVVAFSNEDDVAYTLFTGDGEEHANVKWFLDSFEVDPRVASKAHADLTKSAKAGSIVSIVWLVSVGILAAAAISIIVSIVRNRRK